MFKWVLGSKRYVKSSRCLSSSFQNIAGLLNSSRIGDSIEVKGWIKSLRNQKENIFIDISDGLTEKRLQILIPKDIKPKSLSTGSSVIVKGFLSLSPKGHTELTAQHVDVCGECVIAEGYPFAPRKEYTTEYVRQYLHFRPRTNAFSSLLRVRNSATLAFYNYLDKEGFINVHTPILTSNDCEGAGEVFKVIPDNDSLIKSMRKPEQRVDETYFDTKSFLTVSGQLHLEAVAHSLSKVYTLGPTFRAENSRSRLHLSEFYMLEAEVAFLNRIEELTEIIEKMIKSVTKDILDRSAGDIEKIGKNSCLDLSWIDKKFPIITYEKAVTVLANNQDLFKEKFNEKEGLTKEHELFLVKYSGNVPLFIVNWPSELKPFYMRECNNDITKVSALDLLGPEVGEIAGGSLRENNYNKLKDRLSSGHDLDWYLELRKFGSVPTGGFGLGFERYLQFLLGISNIKDVIPFPRWPHNCTM